MFLEQKISQFPVEIALGDKRTDIFITVMRGPNVYAAAQLLLRKYPDINAILYKGFWIV